MSVRSTEAIRQQVRTLAASMNTGVRETEALRQKLAAQRSRIQNPAQSAQLDALQRSVEQLNQDCQQLQRDFMRGLEQFAAPAPKISPQQAAALWRAAASGNAAASRQERSSSTKAMAGLLAIAVLVSVLAYLFVR
jgi:hypothetical protein